MTAHVRFRTRLRWLTLGAAGAATLLIVWGAWRSHRAERPGAVPAGPTVPPARGGVASVALSGDAYAALGIELLPVARVDARDALHLSGVLAIDPARLVHIHSRFPGEVVSLGRIDASVVAPGERSETRTLHVGDEVRAGQLLAVVWCREIGEKKSDLVDALSQLILDRKTLDRLRALPGGTVAQRTIDEAERHFEADEIAAARAERTLRSWRLTDEEIAAVRQEAESLHEGQQTADDALLHKWSEVEVRSPLDGTLLETNVVPGDLVSLELDLFKVADLTRLRVMANAYEEDLVAVESLPPEARRWQVQIKADPGREAIEGVFDLIGHLVDPSQHTAVITGNLPNPSGEFRVGQFVTATIELPSRKPSLAVPESALLDKGDRSFVFVAEDDGSGQNGPGRARAARFARHEVRVRGRSEGRVLFELLTTDATALREGDLVATRGVVEIDGALEAEQLIEGSASEELTPEREASVGEARAK